MKDQIKEYNKKYNLDLDFDTFSRETRALAKKLMIEDKIKPNYGVVELIRKLKENKIQNLWKIKQHKRI